MPAEPAQVERHLLIAVEIDAARQLAAQVALNEGLRLLVPEIEEIRPVAAADLQHVAKALGGDEADLGALALGQRVDHHGGAVGEKIQRRDVDLGLFEHGEDALFEVGGRGVGISRCERSGRRCACRFRSRPGR